jgi:uncharacterized protein (TIGR03437 family)
LTGGGGAANVGPGSLVSICVTTCATLGTNSAPPFTFGSNTVSADLTKPTLPTQMGGVEVYFNGIQSPLLYVSPTQINAQVPWDVGNTTSLSAYVRSVMSDGSIQVTSPVAVSIVPANPGIFSQNPDANGYSNPRIAWAYHEFSQAHGVVSVDGTPGAGDTETVTIGSRTYNYTTAPGDTLDSIRDNLVALINTDPQVTAYASTDFDRIVLLARVAGPDGDGIVYGASTSSGASTTMTGLGRLALRSLCCANIAGALVTPREPGAAGEIIYVYATGLGLPVVSPLNQGLITTGSIYPSARRRRCRPTFVLFCLRHSRRQLRRRAEFRPDTGHRRPISWWSCTSAPPLPNQVGHRPHHRPGRVRQLPGHDSGARLGRPVNRKEQPADVSSS